MKHMFDNNTPAEILDRLEKISPQSQRQWGKMDVSQMLAHCGNGLEMAMGKINPKRVFIGRLMGGLFKSEYSNEKPFSQGSPTSAELKVTGLREFVKEKERLAKLIEDFAAAGPEKTTTNPHPFFGKLSQQEWGRGIYKHLDHHFRQFGA